MVGDVAGKDCVLVDDLIDTAGTIAGACHVLQDAGAKSVTVVATHGVLSGPAIERLKNCGAREVVLTDTVPIPEEKRWDGLTVLSIAPLLASAIRAVFEERLGRRTVRHLPRAPRSRLPVRLITCVFVRGKHTMRDATWRSLSVNTDSMV